MKKRFAVRALQRILEVTETKHKLMEFGIDLLEFEDGVILLESSIALLFTNDDKSFQSALNMVQWWLYEDAEKVLWIEGGGKQEVKTPEAFVDWLEQAYAK